MSKKTIFARILAVVSEEMDVPPSEILSKSHREDVVDARHILIHFLYKYGFYPYQIAEFLSLTPRSVNHAISGMDERLGASRFLRRQTEIIRNRLGNN